MVLQQGRIIAERYEIIEKIGSGGMSVVYRAKDLKLDRYVTFKVLRAEHLENEAFIRRFIVEARAVASLNHPNIVNVYDVGQEGDINYIVMEFIDGVTLKELIVKKAPFDNVETLGVAIQIASALSHAHKSGIVHRDIKPQNVLVTASGTVKVTDFGIARSINAQTQTISGSTMGSVHYFSPEQAKGGYVDDKSDLYSLGIVMFEMATGALPYDGEESVAVALMHVNDPLPDMVELNPYISKSVESIILRLTQKAAAARYGSADKTLSDLRMAITKPDMIMGLADADEEDADIEDADETEAPAGFLVRFKIELAAIATAIVIIVILIFAVRPLFSRPQTDFVKIPNLVGLTYEAAVERAANARLDTEILEQRYDEDAEAGIVLKQNYAVDGNLEPGDVIGIVISLGPQREVVPNVTNIELSVAESRLSQTSFGFEVEYEYSTDTAFGIIISQEPAAETLAVPGEKIVLTVSRGTKLEQVIVPDLIGLTEAQAKNRLTEEGLTVGHINTGYSARYAEGLVSLQTTAAGRNVLKGTTVGFVVSLGPAPAEPSPDPNETAPPGETTPTEAPDELDKPDEPIEPNEPPVERELNLTLRPSLPEGVDTVVLTLTERTANGFVTVYEQEHTRFDFPVIVPVRGTGQTEYHMIIDGVNVGSQMVDFDSQTGVPGGGQ